MKRAFISIVTLAFAVHAASAAPVVDGPNLDYVAADASWVVHFDVQTFVNSKIGQRLMDERADFEFREEMDEIRRELDVEPLELVRWITAYGEGGPDDGPEVVIAETTDALDRIIEKAGEEADEYRTISIGDYKVHAWEGGYAHIRERADRRLVVFTEDDDQLRRALKVIDDDDASAEDEETMTVDGRKGMFLFVRLIDFEWMGHRGEKMSVVADKARTMSLLAGETDGTAWATLQVAMEREQDARDLADIAQGFIALGRVMAREDEELRRYQSLLRSIRIDADGASLMLNIEFDPEQVLFDDDEGDEDDRWDDRDGGGDDDDEWGRDAA